MKGMKPSGNYIRYHRVANHLKQFELADLLGVHPSAVSNWENGRANPQKRFITAMMDLFHCTYEELFPYEDPNGYRMPERFGGEPTEEEEDVPVEDDCKAVALDGPITIEGPWCLREYRADAASDILTLENIAKMDPVPIDAMRRGGPWTVMLIPTGRASELVRG